MAVEITLPIVAQVMASGVLLGTVYALLACGLNLIFGVMRVINISHGELMMLGAYTTFYLFSIYRINPILSLFISMPIIFFIGVVVQKFFVSKIVEAPELTSLLVTFGISIFIMNMALYFWTADFRSVPYLTGSVVLIGLALSKPRLVSFAVALTITLTVYLFLKKSTLGKAIRAASQSPDIAMVCGINLDRVRHIAFGMGAALAAAAGTLLSTMYAIYPAMGEKFILKAFAIIVLGGMGSFVGAFIGALILGLTEALTAFLISAQLSEAVAYIVLVLVLLLKPSGLMGVRE